MNSDRDAERMIRLLSALVVLLALLVVGLGAGAAFAYAQYHHAKKAVAQAKSGESMEEAVANASKLATELDSRRDRLSKDLKAQAELTEKRVHELEQRRQQEAGVAKGPVDKMEQMFRMTQIGIDEGIAALEHLAGTQKAMADAVSKEEQPATGGSGAKASEEAQGNAEKRQQQEQAQPPHGKTEKRLHAEPPQGQTDKRAH